MLWTIIVVLLVLWLLASLANVGGQAIHFLLVIAGAVFIYNLIRSRRAAF